VNGHLYWVAPLEFQGLFKWMNRGTSPGYIMVDAEDPTAQPVLKTGYNMKYMTSAYFSTELTRHLYQNGYDHVRLRDINFEVTDELKPKWVITLTQPTVLNTGDVVTGVAIVDPESGEIEEYPVGSAPSWVDRVMPEETAKDYLSWYGGYVHGWWNSVTAGQDVNVISSDDMWLIHGQNGRAYWFCGMTSSSSSDQSLTSIVLIDSRDGTISQYRLSGWNEQAVINAVDVAVSNFKTYHASAPIPYDCSGNLAYVVPIAATSGNGEIFQEVAIVDAHTGHVSLGNTKAIALEGYKRYLNTNGYNFAITASSTRKNITGSVSRISQIIPSSDSGYRLIWLNDSNIIYEVAVSQYPTVALTYVTDNVSMSYEDSNDTVINVDYFKNADVIPRVSAEQQNYTLARTNATIPPQANNS
jgi:hypothetical protein